MAKRSSLARNKYPTVVTWRRERARELLMSAATTLFARDGIDATTIDQIVNEAGVAKGTFYNYFTDRSEIAHALADQMRSDLRDAVAELNSGLSDMALRVSRAVRLYLAFAERCPTRARLLLRLYVSVVDPTRHGNELLVTDISAGIRTERFRVPNAVVASHLVLGLTMAAMRHILDGDLRTGRPKADYENQIATLLLQGLGLRSSEIHSILQHPFDPTGLALFGASR